MSQPKTLTLVLNCTLLKTEVNVDGKERQIWSYPRKNGKIFVNYSGNQQTHTAGENLNGKI